MALAEHHPVEGGGELEADHHAGLLARHVEPGDGGHVGGPALGARHTPVYAATLAERLNLSQRKLKHKTIITDWYIVTIIQRSQESERLNSPELSVGVWGMLEVSICFCFLSSLKIDNWDNIQLRKYLKRDGSQA